MHCKVEGPAAYDILINFEQRWRRSTKWREFRLKKVTHWYDDSLINLDRIGITPSTGPHSYKPTRAGSEKETENWHIQVGNKGSSLEIIYEHALNIERRSLTHFAYDRCFGPLIQDL